MCVESSKLPAAETDSPRYGRFAVLDPTYRSRKCRERGRKKLGELNFSHCTIITSQFSFSRLGFPALS